MFERENKMEPGEVAELVLDRVMDYCSNNYYTPLKCLANHSPDQLDVFMDSYLEDEDNDINEAIENSDQKFWEAIEKEYEKLWKEKLTNELSHYLGNALEFLEEAIMKEELLNSTSKIIYLKAYAERLDKFADSIKHALQNGKPLSDYEFYGWIKKICNFVCSINNYDLSEEAEYLESNFYGMLDDNEKLEVLRSLLNDIAYVLYLIEEEDIPDLEALTNKS